MLKLLNPRKNFYLYFLLFINIVAHFRVFTPGIANDGDWIYIHNGLLSKLYLLNIWVSHSYLGDLNVFLNNIYFYWFSSHLFNLFGIDWNSFTKFFFIFPMVVFTPITSYLFFRKVLKSESSAFYSASFFVFNTFFLKLFLDWVTYGFCWWVTPLILLLIIKYKETNLLRYSFSIIFLYFLLISVEIRIAILIIIFSLFFALYLSWEKNNIKKGLFFTFKVILLIISALTLHSSWILTLLFSKTSVIDTNASQNVFVSFYSLIDLFTMRFYGWQSNNLIANVFVKVNVDFRAYFLIFFIVFGIIYSYLKDKKNYFFYMFFLLLFLFLGKQENLPFKDFYGWLFKNIPIFNLYRESSKFFILIALCLSYFFGVALENLNYSILKNKYIKISIVFILLVFNIQNFITGKIGGMSVNVDIPKDYIILKDIFSKDESFYRTLWIPGNVRWEYSDMNHPSISYFFLRDLILGENNDCNYYLKNYSIKYIIYQPEFKDKSLDNNIKYFYEASSCNLRPVDFGLKDLKVFENIDFNSHFFLSDIVNSKIILDSQMVSPALYKVKISNLDQQYILNFTEKYDSEWSIRVGDFNWYSSIQDSEYFLNESIHSKSDLNLNLFTINPDLICSKYYCEKNIDGSYNLVLNIYNRRDANFQLGNIISALFLTILFFIFLVKILKIIWISFRKNK